MGVPWGYAKYVFTRIDQCRFKFLHSCCYGLTPADPSLYVAQYQLSSASEPGSGLCSKTTVYNKTQFKLSNGKKMLEKFATGKITDPSCSKDE